jgi:hypothetical protein
MIVFNHINSTHFDKLIVFAYVFPSTTNALFLI